MRHASCIVEKDVRANFVDGYPIYLANFLLLVYLSRMNDIQKATSVF